MFKWLFIACFFLSTSAFAKIFDCFIFFNELEILKVRLEELYDHVDYFVLVESCETFKGQPKPYYFEENKEQFQKYLSKIIHIKLEKNQTATSPWDREHFQRNCIVNGLNGTAKPEDIIIISDLDEIPRNTILPVVQRKLDLFPLKSKVPKAVVLELKNHPFSFNRYDGEMQGPIGVKYRELKKRTSQELRNIRAGYENIPNAGWHFTCYGGLEKIKLKIQSYSHTADEVYNAWGIPQNASFETLLDKSNVVPIDDSFPKCIRENIEYYRSIGYILD